MDLDVTHVSILSALIRCCRKLVFLIIGIELNENIADMKAFIQEGKVRNLGISNCYDYNFFTTLYEMATIKPKVLQNRFYSDSNFDTELRKFCKERGIWYQSFWTLTANRHALALPEAARGKAPVLPAGRP